MNYKEFKGTLHKILTELRDEDNKPLIKGRISILPQEKVEESLVTLKLEFEGGRTLSNGFEIDLKNAKISSSLRP